MKFKIINEASMSMNDVRDELKKIKSRDVELSFRAQKTMDYLDQMVSLNDSVAKELFKSLVKLEIPRLKEQHIHKLMDILPVMSKDVKTVLQGYAVTVTNDNLKKIADVIAEVVQKK